MLSRRRVSQAVLDAWAVVAPTECSGCGAPDRGLCDACRIELSPRVHASARTSAHPSITVWSALDYSGAARRVIGAYKDGGRTDAAPVLGHALRAAVAAALENVPPHPLDVGGGVQLVTVPSSRAAMRLRGYSPVGLLLREAGLRASPILVQAGKSADQAGLDREARQSNRHGSLAAVRPLDGALFLIVDDIVTTGSTLFEAHRAITESGGEVVGFATLAETRRRYGAPDPSQETRQQKL